MEREPLGRFAIDDGHVERLVQWTSEAAPNEACGVMLGRRVGARLEVLAVRMGRNLATDPARAFELHPEDHLAAERAAEASGLELVGVWHSHPRAPAQPSPIDRAAAWNGWAHAIVGRNERGEFELRVWRASGDVWIELERSPGTRASCARVPDDSKVQ